MKSILDKQFAVLRWLHEARDAGYSSVSMQVTFDTQGPMMSIDITANGESTQRVENVNISEAALKRTVKRMIDSLLVRHPLRRDGLEQWN